MSHRYTLTALAVASLFTQSAQSAPANEAEAGTVIVTATRQPQRANELINDVTVLTREKIEQAGPAASLGEVLAHISGVEMSRQGSRGASESVFLRGANSGHTLVLLDGFRVGSATLGATALEMIPLTQIERIEVLKGPGSALYGTDAIGGVINITTRPASGVAGPTVAVGFGDHDTYASTFGYAGGSDIFHYSVKAGKTGSTGVSNVTNPSSAAYNPDRDGYWRRDASVHLDYKLSDTLDVGGQYFESEGENKFDSSWPTATADWRMRHKVSETGAYLRGRLQPGWTSVLRVGRGVDDTVSVPSSTIGKSQDAFRTTQDQFTWQNDVKLPVGTALAVFERLEQKVASSQDYTVKDRTIDSVSAGWNGHFDRHRLQANLRYDRNSQFGSKTTETLGYGYQIDEVWRVAGNFGTAFKAPTLNDLYFPNTAFVGVGNPNLQPEFARSREVAVYYERTGHTVALTAFHNNIDNLITWDETTPGSWFYTPKNIGQARINGWSASYAGHYGAWNLGGNVNAQDPVDVATGHQLNRRAKTFGSVLADRAFGAWHLGGEIKSVGARFDDMANTRRMGGYTVLNVNAAYNVDRNWVLFARADNVFGKRYEQVRSSTTDYATLGTAVFVGVRYAPK